MWIISVLPEWVFHMLLIAGILGVTAGFVLGMIPVVKRYTIPIRVISLIVLSLALYLEGGLADNKEWELKVKEMEAKVAKAEAEAANKNTEIQEKVVEKTKVIREKGRDIIKYIDREVVKDNEVIKYVERCPAIPAAIIEEHNKAATK